MSDQTLTVTLPEPLIHRLQRAAALTYRTVDDVVASVVDITLHAPPDLPPELADEIAAMALFTDDALWSASESSLSRAQQRRMVQLTQKSREQSLTPAESTELDRLLEQYDQAVLRRAYALALLTQRGYQLPGPSQLNLSTEDSIEDPEAFG
ncbi:MAG: hypothetical protein R3C14_27675 [Caldilineaceae bacterium]